MIEALLAPFAYEYMVRAIIVSALVGGTCAFLSAYLMLKGWSLMGDALAHSIVPGVALASILALPYAVGAFFSGLLAAISMLIVKHKTNLREDAIIGLVFTGFFAGGLVLISVYPTSISLQGMILGNILSIGHDDMMQVVGLSVVVLGVLAIIWKDLMSVFFDPVFARSIGLPTQVLMIVFFTLLSAAATAALQTVGACLVIAMLVTPGATAYLLTDRFDHLVRMAVILGAGCGALGVYASYFLDVHPAGLVVCLQTALFLIAFFFAPKHGYRAQYRRAHGS